MCPAREAYLFDSGFSATPEPAQGLLLALPSGITPGSAGGTIGDAKERQTRSSLSLQAKRKEAFLYGNPISSFPLTDSPGRKKITKIFSPAL